jgi:hypothetical protein
MCFTVVTRTIKEAEMDIICFKTVDKGKKRGRYRSYWQAFEYEDGYHYYNKNFPKKVLKWQSLGSEGLHSFTSIDDFGIYVGDYSGTTILIECYIPKGAKYLTNKANGVYISSDLVIVGQVTKERFNEICKKAYRIYD